MNRSATLGELRGLLDIASDDELAAFAVIARRVMGGGRVQYGPLDLATDKRNFAKEAADEAADLLWYAAIREVQAGYADPLVCADCGESGAFVAQHKPDCPWRVIVPGKGE